MSNLRIYKMGLEKYLLMHYTGKTAAAYQREIEIYISNNKKAEKFTYSEIVCCIGILRARYSSPGTLSRILASIKAYYSYLCFTGIRKDNPAKSIRLRDKRSRDIQLQDLFEAEELEALLTAKQERYAHLGRRNKALMSLLIYQALKPNEIEALQCSDINLEEASVYIKPSAKNNSRTLALRASQILLFKKYLEETRVKLAAGNETGAFIIGHRKEPMSAGDITKHIKRSYNIYGTRKVNALAIRQSVIANLLKAGNDLRIVQTFAGHKYPSATERYRQSGTEALQAACRSSIL
jgi:integrase/recombinase XerD